MMMQGISASASLSYQLPEPNKLSDEQAEDLTNFLSEFDTDNISDEDAKEIVSQIKELGIGAGSELASALSDAGINAMELAKQAGIGSTEETGAVRGKGRPDGPPPPPPPPQDTQGISSVDDTILTLIADAVDTYNVSDDDDSTSWSAVSSALEDAGYDTSVSLINFYA